MKVEHTNRGFEVINLNPGKLQQSSKIGDYEDAFDKPGSSFLWFNDAELSREECEEYLKNDWFDREVVPHVEAWLKTGSLICERPSTPMERWTRKRIGEIEARLEDPELERGCPEWIAASGQLTAFKAVLDFEVKHQ